MAKLKGPQFVVYISPILETLKNMGGAGKTAEVIDRVIEFMKIPDKEVEKTIPSGGSRVRNRIQWARLYLSKAGLLDSSEHGVWRLTDRGATVKLNDEDVNKLYRNTFKGNLSVFKLESIYEQHKYYVRNVLYWKYLESGGALKSITENYLSEIGINGVDLYSIVGIYGIDVRDDMKKPFTKLTRDVWNFSKNV